MLAGTFVSGGCWLHHVASRLVSVLLYLILLRNATRLPEELVQSPSHFETVMTPLATAAHSLLYPNGLVLSPMLHPVQLALTTMRAASTSVR